ncbi:hypothetical protein SAMN05421787_108108 [Virgibacillus pantothenticus]|nr:hypothetical protein SAMN05421787_108108 [Virgibacillus pantothenticus]
MFIYFHPDLIQLNIFSCPTGLSSVGFFAVYSFLKNYS